MESNNRTIHIEENSCIKCGKCSQVCPAEIMIQDKTTKEIRLEQVGLCIGCGHCVDVCPTGSVIHLSLIHISPSDNHNYPAPNLIFFPNNMMQNHFDTPAKNRRLYLYSAEPENHVTLSVFSDQTRYCLLYTSRCV